MTTVHRRKPTDQSNDQTATPSSDTEEADKDLIWTVFKSSIVILISIPVVALVYLQLFVTSPIEPQGHTFDPIPKFEGPLAANNKLLAIEKLFHGEFRGPESMGFYKGKIYTGVGDGRIVELDLGTNTMRTVVKTLGVPPCGGLANEPNCGRPLGMRVKQGYIYLVDAYLGLFKIHIESGHSQNLFKASMPLPDGFPSKFLNDVEVAPDGKIYMTDSSSRWTRENHPYVGFENRPDGRLIVHDPSTNETRVLLRDLYFANGLQMAADGSWLLITEMSRCRVIKYYLTGDKAGQSEIFSDNLPGLPDNIRSNDRGGFWVALAVTRHPDMWSVWDTTAPYPWIKTLMAKVFHMWTIGRMTPKYGLVIELDGQGKIVRSLHDPTGSTLPAASEVQEVDGVIYFGSYFLPFLGRLDLTDELYSMNQ